jgi:hypothetical protein
MRDSPLPTSFATFHAAVLSHVKPACVLAGTMSLAKCDCNRRSGLHFHRNQCPLRSIRHHLRSNLHKGHLAPIEIPYVDHRIRRASDLLQTTLSKLSPQKILPQSALVAPGQSR